MDKTPENYGDQGDKQQSNHTSIMFQLASLCENDDLEDVRFIDELGMIIQNEETSARLTPL